MADEPGHPENLDPCAFLRALFDTAVRSADPAVCVPGHLPEMPRRGRIRVVGAGKASAAMARTVETHARRDGWLDRVDGIVVTRYGHGVPCERIEIVEAAHPVPDAAGADAARRIRDAAEELGEDDLLLCLISGGGSALLSAPADDISAEEKAAITRALLRSGAPIAAMNCVRKHISSVKGGHLAAAAVPARVVSLMISDVPGDDPSVIASGPTVPDPTTCADALAHLDRFAVEVPGHVRRFLETGAGETPKPGDPAFDRVENIVVARPAQMLEAAAELARSSGVAARILGDDLEGEARELGAAHAELALRARQSADEGPLILLSGGETTVTVRGDGRGGRNAEYALGLARALDGATGIYAIACDTDGIDGMEDNAGVIVAPDTLTRARSAGFEAAETLARNDAYSLFDAVGDLVKTGPTLTNVNDFRAIFVNPKA